MLRSLPPLHMGSTADTRAPSPLPPLGHDISRPSSTSTQQSLGALHHQQPTTTTGVSLPGLSTLASVAAGHSPPMSISAFSGIAHGCLFPTASPTPTSVSGQGANPPICQNCKTSTTPLWRRDEVGSVLCNACGLFLKLHGRPRPISLKTDVIKSRNRVKSSNQGQKKKPYLNNGVPRARSEDGSPPLGYRRVSQRSSGASELSNSPISRTNTPGVHHSNISSHHIFDAATLGDSVFVPGHSPSLPSLHFRQPSPGSTISFTDRHLEPPHTYEALKTKVNELELINGLCKDRITQLEHHEGVHRQNLEQSSIRETELRRRVADLENELAQYRKNPPSQLKRPIDMLDNSPYPKRIRTSNASEYPELPQASI